MTSLRKELEKREFETLDLFTVSFSLFISNFTNFLILALICSLPLILTSIYFPVRMFDPEKVKTAEDIIKWFQNDVTIGFYINIFLSWFLDTLSVIAVSLLKEGLVYKRRKTATWAILKSFNFIFPALVTSFMYFVLVFLGLSFFIVPGVALIILFVFIQNVCALRHTWGINALKYSFYLAKPKFFKVLFILTFIFFFQRVYSITFLSTSIDTREGLLSYFISMIVLYIFDIYFKVIMSLFFLNRDYIMSNNVSVDETVDDDDEINE